MTTASDSTIQPFNDSTSGSARQYVDGRLIPQKIKVDDPTIEHILKAYPDEVHDDVRWLAGWFRIDCNHNQEVLVERARKAGFKRSKNYFYQVFTGRYFKPVEGEENPAGQIANFCQLVDRLRSAYVTAQRAGKITFVETGTYQKIRNYIDIKRLRDNVCKFGVVIGHTGSQKTASFDHYCEENNHGKCVRIESPYSGSISQLIYDLSNRYGASRSERKARRLAIIHESVRNDRCIIIDNCQRMYRERKGTDQPMFHFLQKLQDDTDCTIILSITPDSAKFLTDGMDRAYFEQFEGRAGGRETFLELDEHTPASDIRDIAMAFGFSAATYREAAALLNKLARSPGRIRILFNVLQTARRHADRQKEKTLTLDHLLTVRPDLNKVEVEKS
jgi:DNA transposition AAA+ family ATPase